MRRPVLSVLSIIGGLLSGLGVLVLLQQAGVVYPTLIVTILALVLGLVWGIVVPTLVRGRAPEPPAADPS